MKTDPAMNRRQITDPAKIREFALAGDARLTLESAKTGQRYTFRIAPPDLKPGESAPSIWFASLLTGSDNEGDYSYFGNIKLRQAGHFFEVGRKSRLQAESAPVKAFAWFWSNLMKGHVSDTLRVWHEGRCCRCGRALTVPSSIENGVGPECVKHFGGGFVATPAPARKLAGHATATGWDARPVRKAKVPVMHARPFDDSLDGVFGEA